MKLEAVKSFILVILIGISLVLTLGLWTAASSEEEVYDTSAVREVDVGGVTVKNQDVIRPSSIIFHEGESVYGFDSPKRKNGFFKETNNWEIYPSERTNEPDTTAGNYAEVTFPTDIPFQFMSSLYQLDDSFFLPTWSVKKVHFRLNEPLKVIDVTFFSGDGINDVTGVINSHQAFETLQDLFTDKKGFVTYETKEAGDQTLYVSAEQQKVTHWVLSIQKIDERLFVNTLFNNPSAVGKNIGEGSYLDGQRALRISSDRRSMEYMNPHHMSEQALDHELLHNSIVQINEHKGWTGVYHLDRLNADAEQVEYRLYYEGHPIFDPTGLAKMTQEWRGSNLYNYRRSLFELMTPLTNESVIMPSGSEVYEKIQSQNIYDMDQVSDMRIGYRLEYHDDYSSVTLRPNWYVLYKGSWQEVQLDDTSD